MFATGQASPLEVGDSGRKCPDLWLSVAGFTVAVDQPADRRGGESVRGAVNHSESVVQTHTHTHVALCSQFTGR